MEQQTVKMCSQCAGAFKYDTNDYDEPDTHADVGKDCPTIYR